MARNKLAGQPRPEEVKQKISRSQQERYRRARAHGGIPPRKRCPRCGVWKDSPKDFGWTKRPLKDGTDSYHPRSICKECQRAKSAEYRERLRNEGVLEQKQKEWNAARRKRKADAAAKREKEAKQMAKKAAYKREQRAIANTRKAPLPREQGQS